MALKIVPCLLQIGLLHIDILREFNIVWFMLKISLTLVACRYPKLLKVGFEDLLQSFKLTSAVFLAKLSEITFY